MSDLILGTAGHIDHGKTTLIRALTGVDTDRLPEEKRRGITIELGFAELELGEFRLGVVDVPGHERFVRQMLSGATGMHLALLVVAADDSVKPQTREQLEVLRLLDLPAGVIALTKCDIADPAWIELVTAEVRELVQGTFLEDAPIVQTSAVSGEGLKELQNALETAASKAAGAIVVAYGGLPILAVGVASLVCAWAYSYGPAPISASPLGEIFVILFFGIAATVGTVWIAAGALDATAILLGAALGLPAAAVLTVNNHRDRAQDAANGRRTLAILLGARATVWLYGFELAGAALLSAYALLPLSRAAILIALIGAGAALVRAAALAHVPVSRALNAQLVATVRFQIALAAGVIALLLGLPR